MSGLPKFEEWKAPWEINSEGKDIPEDEQKIDSGKLKKYLHGLLGDKERGQTKVAEVTAERDALKAKVDEAAREGENETQRLQRENKELEDKLAKGGDSDVRALRLEVALDKGLTALQAKRLVGSTREEIETDADALVEAFGGSGKGNGDEANPLARTPRPLVNAGDPDPDAGADTDVSKVLDQIPRL